MSISVEREDANTFRLICGNVSVYVQPMPYCCGMCLVYGLEPPCLDENYDDELKELHYYLTDYDSHYDTKGDWDNGEDEVELAHSLARCKLVLVDAVGGERGESTASLWKMATRNGWSAAGESILNPNSNNDIQMYEWNYKE